MSRRSSMELMPSPTKRPGASRLSVGSRRSIGGMRPPVTPSVSGTPITGSDTSASAFLAIQNDDEEERRQRQLSRLQQLQHSRQLGSPGALGAEAASSSSDGGRRRSVAALEPRLTGQQLTMHYAKCIQLSAENKINIKNAFNLQLIDYMTEMLRRKDSDMNNFQVASCTLDASTKIYAYRVDCVHTDTVRMAGGLGRTQQEKETEGGEAAPGEEGSGGRLKRRRTKKAATIETNPSALTLSSLDLEFMVDPLFKKIASQFDEGRAGGGLFLNSLMLRDDACQLLLDSEAVLDPMTIEEPISSDPPTVTVPALPDLSQKEICPPFSSFHFTSWKVGDEDSFLDTSRLDKEETDGDKPLEHAFDPNAVPEPLDDDHGFGDDNADYGASVDDCDAGGGEDDDTVAATLGEGGNNTCLTVGWGGQHANGSSMLPPPPPAMETIHLKDHLASMSLEYSYFDSRVMSAWAGPGHWKLKPAARDKTSNSRSTVEGGKKRKKDDFELDYRINSEMRAAIEKQFEVSKRMTKLSQNTIKLWSEDNTTLPVDLHFDPTDFAKLYGRSEVVVRRLADDTTAVNTTLTVDDDDGDDHHDYDDDHHDAGGVQCDTSGGGYDMTLFSQTMLPSSQLRQEAADGGADFLGDNLVQAPNRVAKVNIGYARTAKRMDMRKLKGTVWDMLTEGNQDKENDSNSANVDPAAREEKKQMASHQRIKFSDVYKTLPRRLNSRHMAENLSLPLAFIALLHLCNERNLALTAVGDMEDFTISQG